MSSRKSLRMKLLIAEWKKQVNYHGEYDNAAATLFNNDGKSRAQYANGTFVNGDVHEKPWYKALMDGA